MSVAIAVPSLNQKRFLGDALDSLGGTDVTVRRAVLDAGSTDGSRDLIEARAPELAFWRSEPDGGQAAAVNEGIGRLCRAHADVEAVGWLNADDFFLEHGVKSVVMTDRNMGCPHEEGPDFPQGEDCPFCPFWRGKQGSNRKD